MYAAENEAETSSVEVKTSASRKAVYRALAEARDADTTYSK